VAKGLDRQTIVHAALDLLDEAGIDALTLRALASRLGVQAPALYWHVRNKQELLDEMGTEIERRVVERMTALPMDDWRDALTGYARCLRAEYLAHRDGARTFSGTRLTDPAVLRAQEPWLQAWADAGHSVADAVAAAQLVTAFVVGFVIEEQERTADRYSLAARDAAVGADAPLVAEAGRTLFADPESRFRFQLGMVLDGIGVRFAASPS
jgi:AcrR family transcriptional regulator